ncbi:unnamed protein product [marine sediment metagenome]|uniref:Uncharacterized protein n=1 Tax=marine sediment metagenome TaxID=412755 RepID=X0VI54_9ZZZZ
MVSYRLVLGIIVGIAFSFFTVFFFNMEATILQIQIYLQTDILKVIILQIGANFKFDLIAFFTGTPSITEFFAPQLLACIFIGYVSGTISKGLKRGVIASSLVIIIGFLIWMLLSVISGEDLMALFQGAQLSVTVGGILTAILGAVLGGLLGGFISGPYEEIY